MPRGIKEEEKKYIRNVLSMLDDDGVPDDNKVKIKYVSQVLWTMGQNPTMKEIKDMVAELDPDNTGEFSVDAFVEYVDKHQFLKTSKELVADLEDAFKLFDADKSDSLDRGELKKALTKTGEKPLTEAEAEELFGIIDKNNDGMISLSEFLALSRILIFNKPEPEPEKEEDDLPLLFGGGDSDMVW